MEMVKDVIVEGGKVRIWLGDEVFKILKEKKFVKKQELYYSVIWDSDCKLYFDNLEKDILALPLILNIAPIIWRVGLHVTLERVEEKLAESLEALYRSYRWIYRELPWRGKIVIKERYSVNQQISSDGICLFSFGADSVTTYIRNKETIKNFLSIVGSDVKADDEEGRERFRNTSIETCSELGVTSIGIETNFRTMIDEGRLGRLIPTGMNWWHGFQHGPALAAFLLVGASALGCGNAFIASTYPADTLLRIGSRPDLEGLLKYGDIPVRHDSADINRTQKLDIIAKEMWPYPLHVCWISDGFENCGHCEKCLRTILGFLVLGDIEAIDRYFNVRYDLLKNEYENLFNGMTLMAWNRVIAYEDIKKFIKSDDEYINKYHFNDDQMEIIKLIRDFDPHDRLFEYLENQSVRVEKRGIWPFYRKRVRFTYTPSM